jgi:phage FluMu protein Com
MIEIELPQALALYSILLGLLAAGIWLYTELTVRRPQRRLGQQFLWKCTFCGCTYLDQHAEKLSKCPRCENLNRADEAAVFEITDSGARKATPPPEPVARNTSRRKRTGQRTRGPRRRR